MTIFDTTTMKEILQLTSAVLRNNFFYEDESLSHFLNHFTMHIEQQLTEFETYSDEWILNELHGDSMVRYYFTCYFVSAHLRKYFIGEMNFSEQELYAFESVLPKYTGEKSYENKPKRKRTNYRKFSK